jgi:hypothetical protein
MKSTAREKRVDMLLIDTGMYFQQEDQTDQLTARQAISTTATDSVMLPPWMHNCQILFSKKLTMIFSLLVSLVSQIFSVSITDLFR